LVGCLGRPEQEPIVTLYYFHLIDGHQTLIDPEGRNVVDPAQLGVIALGEARAMIAQDVLGGRIPLNQFIEVRDENGKLIHQLSFRDAVTISGRAETTNG